MKVATVAKGLKKSFKKKKKKKERIVNQKNRKVEDIPRKEQPMYKGERFIQAWISTSRFQRVCPVARKSDSKTTARTIKVLLPVSMFAASVPRVIS